MIGAGETPFEPPVEASIRPAGEGGTLAPESTGVSAGSPHDYWLAQAFAERILAEFNEAHQRGDAAAARTLFFLVADYFARTVSILRYALAHHREALVRAALRNLVSLHRALHAMHQAEPDAVPEALTVGRDTRLRLFEDMIIQVLREWPGPHDVATITRRVNELDILADATESTIARHLANLIASGHLRLRGESFSLTTRTYRAVNLEQAGLHTLIDPTLTPALERAGFHGLSDALARKEQFHSFLSAQLDLSDETATLFLAAAEVLGQSVEGADIGHWRHADLIGSAHPRPYQYEAYAIFRGYGYQGQLIEAPTGSGKTLIGMMCIQDWLHSLAHGQTVLVLVPTVNYQQQWVRELCHAPTGLQLPPHQVFTGTPAALEAARRRVDFEPCVLVVTYAALAQIGSGVGKGGFDVDSIETFLQGNNVQYVILDEVHKVVEDLRSVSSDVARALVDWLRDGSLRGLIGFSGTAAAYRPRFNQVGLQLAYVVPAGELIAYGFVAPFAEIGVPFAFSERERNVRDLVEAYRETLHEYFGLVGSRRLRDWFTEIPLAQRIVIGRDLLRMYAGRPDQAEALAQRFAAWEGGDRLTTPELPLVTMVQLARGWSDQELARNGAPEGWAAFDGIKSRLDQLRADLSALVYLPDTRRRLSAEGFGIIFDAARLRALPGGSLSATARLDQTRQGLATSFVGLLGGLSEWYQRIGEGRVGAIKAVIEAERTLRPIQGTIVFDTGRRIRWQDSLALPGYAGVGGLFAELLGDRRFTPMAVLSSEIYLPYDDVAPLPARIAAFIRQRIMLDELGSILFKLATEGLALGPDELASLRPLFESALSLHVERLPPSRLRRREFGPRVISPLRRAIRRAQLGVDRTRQVLNRLNSRQYYLRDWLGTFLDYAAIADRFGQARTAQLEQVGGTRQQFFVVPMAQGDRKQLMYDLTARLADATELPIDLILVSSWARTGWNVVEPNLLIDATATRDVVAWQQLRGRAMRARRLWTNACYQATVLLLGSDVVRLSDFRELPADVLETFEELTAHSARADALDGSSRSLLSEAHRACARDGADPLSAKIERAALKDFSPAERRQLASELMLARNKVTHIYELVKASGSAPQVHYDRSSRRWTRSDAIAAKHAAEIAVGALDGRYVAGPDHAPLLYAADPRRDVPSALRQHLETVLAEADTRIVQSWLTAIPGEGGGAEMLVPEPG